MKSNVDQCLKLIAGSEGGYSNNPKDPGGPTMKGVTLVNYQRYCATKRRPTPGIEQLKKITDAEVEEIFRLDYWDRVRGDDLPAGLDYACADFGFNSGPGQAIKELQRVVTDMGFDAGGADGKIGSGTLSAVRAAMTGIGEDGVINAYQDKRLAFMKSLSTWETFKNGWKKRVDDVRVNALRIAHGDSTYGTVAHAGASAKADPADTKMSAVTGGTSTIVTVGGAVATGVGQASSKLLEHTGSVALQYLPYFIAGFVVLTVVGAVITAIVLKNKPKEEGVV